MSTSGPRPPRPNKDPRPPDAERPPFGGVSRKDALGLLVLVLVVLLVVWLLRTFGGY